MTTSSLLRDPKSYASRLRGEDGEAAELELWTLAYGVCRWLGATWAGLSEPTMFFNVGNVTHLFTFKQCDALNALYAELEGAGPANKWAAEQLAALKAAHDRAQEEHEQL